MTSSRGTAGQAAQLTQVSSFEAGTQLRGPSFDDIVPEPWSGGPPP